MKKTSILLAFLIFLSLNISGQTSYNLTAKDIRKPYKQVYLWGTIQVTNLSGKVVRTDNKAYQIALAVSNERVQRNVLLLQSGELSRVYVLDKLLRRAPIKISDDIAENLHSTSIMETWQAFYEKNGINIPVTILLHKKNNWLFLVQMRELQKNIYSYMP